MEWICSKKLQHARISLEQSLLREDDPRRSAPGDERGKPQIPIEAWLVRGIEAGSFFGILRLVAKGIRDPRLPIVAALKLYLVPRGSHDGEEAVRVRNADQPE